MIRHSQYTLVYKQQLKHNCASVKQMSTFNVECNDYRGKMLLDPTFSVPFVAAANVTHLLHILMLNVHCIKILDMEVLQIQQVTSTGS